jgi:glycogen operon protein
MTRLKAITALTLACAGLAPTMPAHADINEMQLGASISKEGKTVNFTLYSYNATHIQLCLFASPQGANAILTRDIVAPNGNGVWSAQIPMNALTNAGISTVYYGYRAWGPNWIYNSSWTPGRPPASYRWSIPPAIASIPTSSCWILTPSRSPATRLTPASPTPTQPSSPVNSTGIITQQIAPKGIVVTPAANAFGTKPTRAQKDDVIYEMNVRGMTANDSSIPQAERGTYAGAAQKAAYLQSLGVTAVELQPVQEVQNDQDDIYEATHGGAAPPNGDTGWNSGQYYKDNYWGKVPPFPTPGRPRLIPSTACGGSTTAPTTN